MAYAIGIQKEDILVSYNGELLETTEALIRLATQSQNASNQIELIRGRSYKTIIAPKGALGISVVPRPLSEEVLSKAIAAGGVGVKIAQRSEEISADRVERARNMIITTASSIEGYRVVETIEVISAECVYGMNVFKDIFASFRDVVGGRAKSVQNVLKDARRECLTELKVEALDVGANAVIAVDLDYSELSGSGAMLFLVATGTAVRVEKIST